MSPASRFRRPLSHRLQARGLSHDLQLLEPRRLMSADPPPLAVESYDGSGNNLLNNTWGAVSQPLLRLAAASYTDGKSTPAGATRASARAISNAVAAHPATELPSARNLSAFAYLWGQFIDHDLDLTVAASPSESFNIAVPTGDPSFDPTSTGTQVIPLTRSQYITDARGVRQQLNTISAYIDGSQVYGSDKATADLLRTFSSGHLKSSAGNLLPLDTFGIPMDTNGAPLPSFFAAGDHRANENIELTSLQTLFMREHNRLADQIAMSNPGMTDEQIYQQARKLVIGEIQKITYDEFLPALMGKNAIRPYAGYRPNINVQISNEFSTAAFRLGHSMLPDDVEFLNNDGTDARPDISLAEAFFNPTLLQSTGIDTVLKYVASSNSEEVDTKVVDSLRNFLFGPPGAGGLDLASLNIQRGRDHGLADYNTTRAAFGLPRVKSFSDISSDPAVVAALKSVYTSVDNIDLWVGGLAEDHLPGSSLGPTFQRILADQFTRSRDGDRYFYLSALHGKDLQFVQSTSLADIIKANTTTTNIQPDVFTFHVEIEGNVFADQNLNGRLDRPDHGLGNITVSLTDDTGTVIDTQKTSRDGRYLFSNVPLGTFTVSTSLSSTTTPSTQTLAVTKAEHFSNVNFGTKPPVQIFAGTPIETRAPANFPELSDSSFFNQGSSNKSLFS